jgi:hypothetical protein
MQNVKRVHLLAHLELSYRSKLLTLCSERVKSIWSRRLHQVSSEPYSSLHQH